jgi:hypothetical protein
MLFSNEKQARRARASYKSPSHNTLTTKLLQLNSGLSSCHVMHRLACTHPRKRRLLINTRRAVSREVLA